MQVTKAIAIDMYTACSNPLTLEARVALAKLVLRASDHRYDIYFLPSVVLTVATVLRSPDMPVQPVH